VIVEVDGMVSLQGHPACVKQGRVLSIYTGKEAFFFFLTILTYFRALVFGGKNAHVLIYKNSLLSVHVKKVKKFIQGGKSAFSL